MSSDVHAMIQIDGKMFTRGEIARGTGLSLSHVSRVFSGARVPSLSVLKRIAEFMQVECQALIKVLPSL